VKHLGSVLALLLAEIGVFARLLFADADGVPYRMIPWDFRSASAPWIIYGWDAIRAGFLPLWCPYAGAGVPFFLNPQTQVYSPLAVVLGTLFGYSYRVAQTHSVALMFIGGAGAYALSHHLWRDRGAALVTGLCFELSSTLFCHLEHMPILSAYALAPWLFWSIILVIDRRSPWGLPLLAGVVYWLLTSGYVGVVFMLLLWAAGFAVALAHRQPGSPDQKIRLFGQTAVACALGCGMAAINWMPFAFSTAEFTRGNVLPVDYVLDPARSLAPAHLLGMLYPFITSHPLPGIDVDISMRGIYFGVVAAVLAIAGLVWARGWIIQALVTLAIGALLMAFGGDFFLRVALHILVPVFNYSRFPQADSYFLVVLAASLLAGAGAALLARRHEPAVELCRKAFSVLAIFYGVSFFALTWIYGKPLPATMGGVTFEVLCMLLGLLLLSRFPGSQVLPLAAALVLMEAGYCATTNFEPAGQRIALGQYAHLSKDHVTTFSAAGTDQPRVGDPANSESSAESYVAKKFHIDDYNPLRLVRFESLVSTGFLPWIQTGPRVAAVLPGTQVRNFGEFGPRASKIPFSILEYTPNRVRYQVDAPALTLLVFNEIYFPGWKATIDGAEAPVLPFAVGLRSLNVTRGKHQIELRFRPPVFFVALGVSLLSFLIFAARIILIVRRGRTGSFAAPPSAAGSALAFNVRTVEG
jgi:Bacterial membrane protein YfhO